MADFSPLSQKLDLIEKSVIILFYSFFCYRMFHAYLENGEVVLLIFIFDQFLILFFTLIRKKAEVISLKFSDWLVAILGTLLPLLMAPIGPSHLLPPQFTLPLMLGGIGMHLLAKLSLSRSFGVVPAKRKIKTLGPYRIVRHPMYAGYMFVQLGLLLAGPTLYNLILTLTCWFFYLLRISAEEKILKNDTEYQELIKKTPYRLFPKLY